MDKSILVIDDEAAIRRSFILALEDSGFEVDTAEDGREGIRMAGEKDYGMIYLDLKMPGLNGVETLKRLRAKDKNVPVYIVTAFYGEFLGELRQCQVDGCLFEVLKKPIGIDEILMVTKSVLEEPVQY